MHSVKNLLVIILLMGVSYGAYQVITTPESTAMSSDMEELNVYIDETLGLDEGQPPESLPPQIPFRDPAVGVPTQPAPDSKAPPIAPPPPLALPAVPMPGADDHSNAPQPDPGALISPEAPPTISPNPGSNNLADREGESPEAAPSPGPSAVGGSFQPNLAAVDPKPTPTPAPDPDTKPIPSPAPPTVPEENIASPIVSASINWNGIQGLASQGNLKEALSQLSTHYNSQLTEADKLAMLDWLDRLAGRVIYSTDHCLYPQPYVVQAGDTLETIGRQWNVPGQLIYNVNASNIIDPQNLVPGTELKIIQGPFNAVVNLERQEMTLFLNGMYAGRFAIEVGQNEQGIEYGNFMVQEKQRGQTYSANGQVIAAGDSQNPYGKYWIGLNGNASIHESNPTAGANDNLGSIRLASKDAADVFGILSTGSQVTIQR